MSQASLSASQSVASFHSACDRMQGSCDYRSDELERFSSCLSVNAFDAANGTVRQLPPTMEEAAASQSAAAGGSWTEVPNSMLPGRNLLVDAGPKTTDTISDASLPYGDKIAWAKNMLANDNARHELCDREFAAADHDKSGTLDLEEIVEVVFKICNEMSLKLPSVEKVTELVKKVQERDGNQSATISEMRIMEFRTTLKTVLKSVVQEAEKQARAADSEVQAPDPLLEMSAEASAASGESGCRNLVLGPERGDGDVAGYDYAKQNPNRFRRYILQELQQINGLDDLPSPTRWKIWRALICGPRGSTSSANSVGTDCEAPQEVKAQIDADLRRTFSSLQAYSRYEPDLRDILYAYVAHERTVGYCQGMSHVACILLIVSGSKQEAFEVFLALLERHGLKGLYNETLLERYTLAHEQLMKKSMPNLFRHFRVEGYATDCYLKEWLLTIFAKAFPLREAVAVWDIIFSQLPHQGLPILLRISTCILEDLEPDLLSKSDADCNALIKQSLKTDYILIRRVKAALVKRLDEDLFRENLLHCLKSRDLSTDLMLDAFEPDLDDSPEVQPDSDLSSYGQILMGSVLTLGILAMPFWIPPFGSPGDLEHVGTMGRSAAALAIPVPQEIADWMSRPFRGSIRRLIAPLEELAADVADTVANAVPTLHRWSRAEETP